MSTAHLVNFETCHLSPGAAGAASRCLCTGEVPGLSYQELKDLKKTNVLHIDVRERSEIDKVGKIPASINIPLGELVEALQMDPTAFKEQYNQKMPDKSDPVVFSCFSGKRSKQALAFATSLGFSSSACNSSLLTKYAFTFSKAMDCLP
ncbi:thiosulfate sulfurtransferase rhodanese-like domain-containing protein 3 [Limosa lapponica baueri]|uniref:Thiosulfate sulfurtransferase rhodanese-like domain-containing protein 3 n=1 Tax=Limosa lapponica baueri TaxID=1758121 RepID=A0A2I0TTY3_LIMLA|nr:thiosulfate sulfurtransferase rhodanese-like domain-containing protein 3 [Limosa lapponica baueri]